MAPKVFVGMSGGVDSSVAALLLKEKGYEVFGITMELFSGSPEDNAGDAKSVCDILSIPHYRVDLSRAFKKNVVEYFIEEYKRGATPNPCIACNFHLKWKALFEEIKALGGEYLATGHYSKVVSTPQGRYAITRAKDDRKDQSYVLYRLSQDMLKNTLMPLGEYDKDSIREIALNAGLPVSGKKDSQDICFIPDGDFVGFIEKNADLQGFVPGDFVDNEGRVLGEHKGIYRYTIGQRKNLGIALGKRMYVKKIDVPGNRVVLCDDEELHVNQVYVRDINYMSLDRFSPDREYMAKTRYSQKLSPCRIEYVGECLLCTFSEGVRAPAFGQSLVVYDGDLVAGGGIIYEP